MNFRTVEDMKSACYVNSHLVSGADVIVGIPRSGLLAANLLALHLNKPLTDPAGLCERRLLAGGRRTRGTNFFWDEVREVAVVDDSMWSGASMREVREEFDAHGFPFAIRYGAIYVTPGRECDVDFHFELVEMPRFFEWNFMHHSSLRRACVDIDGVLCRDLTPEENDDGPRYMEFLRGAAPLHAPSVRIPTLVTCRLEKYRKPTEEWLARHGVEYDELIMLDLPSGSARRRWAKHGEFKGEIYRENRDCDIFIESSFRQALTIADVSCRPVFCVEAGTTVHPSGRALASGVVTKVPKVIARRARLAQSTIGTWLSRKAQRHY